MSTNVKFCVDCKWAKYLEQRSGYFCTHPTVGASLVNGSPLLESDLFSCEVMRSATGHCSPYAILFEEKND